MKQGIPEKIIHSISVFVSLLFRKHKGFVMLFFKREGIELAGKQLRSFWILLSIMTITFIAIGFSNGSLNYLEEKMSDPFINWVNIDLPWNNEGLAEELIEVLNNKNIRDTFQFNTVTGYYKYDLIFRDYKRNGLYRGMGRTIEFDNPLVEVIFNDNNLVQGRKFYDEKELGFIVTEKFMNELHLSAKSPFIFIHYSSDNSNIETDIPFPIIAIVKELPDMASFATTPYFYNQRYLDNTGINPFSPIHTHDLVIFIPEKKKKANEIAEKLLQTLKDNEVSVEERSPSLTIEEIKDFPGSTCRISFFPSYDSLAEIKHLFELISSNSKSEGLVQLYDYNTTSPFPYKRYDYLAVNFNSLDKIRAFKNFLFDRHKVELEMSQIESKENFNFVSKLTRFISLILLVFCILSISMFLSNLLKNHLIKIKMNIGTFKAFGLGTVLLKKIYLSIIGMFILLSITLSITISALFGYLGGIRIILKLLRIELESNQVYFELIDYWTLTTIVSMLFVSLYVIYFNNNKLFNDTPGNLINNRE